jgi:general stress protein 26
VAKNLTVIDNLCTEPYTLYSGGKTVDKSTKEALKRKIIAKLAAPTLCVLATVTEDGKPWARYVTPFADDNLTIWLATFANSRKISQIQNNSEVHLTTGVTDPRIPMPYLQIQGKAEILTDSETKKAVWSDYLTRIFSGPDDPNYIVCRITPYHVEWQDSGPKPPEIWEP